MPQPPSHGWYFVLDEPARILVADDDPIFREFATVHISSPVAEVATASDGLDAWDKLAGDTFDIALIDLEMPRLDGFELTTRIRSHARLADLPIVVVTGHEDIRSVDRAYAAGATSFIAKPVNWRLLSHSLKYVLRMSKAERQTRAELRAAREASQRERELAGEATQVIMAALTSLAAAENRGDFATRRQALKVIEVAAAGLSVGTERVGLSPKYETSEIAAGTAC